MPSPHCFAPDAIETVQFVDRPNRFVVRCREAQGKLIEAYLPNPGRLRELLLPGVPLTITRSSPGLRKTRHTVLAVERDGSPILLHTHLTNAVAEHLLRHRQIPGLERATLVRPEVSVGRSRFDFLLQESGRDLYLETKSCTLFGHGVAMFPDAVTDRGRRHLIELAAMARRGIAGAVLFLVHAPRVRWFMPDYHTDLAFSQTLLDVRDHVRLLPMSIRWLPGLTLDESVTPLEIPWAWLDREVQDRGAYLLVLRLSRSETVEVGSLGACRFRRGYYVYVGSAMRNLDARLAHHLRRKRVLHWHIDSLCERADHKLTLPIRSSERQECEVARAASAVLAAAVPRFGTSDCRCPTHLFWSHDDPLSSRAFHDFLQRFRMRPPN